jgi:hypothetical protein
MTLRSSVVKLPHITHTITYILPFLSSTRATGKAPHHSFNPTRPHKPLPLMPPTSQNRKAISKVRTHECAWRLRTIYCTEITHSSLGQGTYPTHNPHCSLHYFSSCSSTPPEAQNRCPIYKATANPSTQDLEHDHHMTTTLNYIFCFLCFFFLFNSSNRKHPTSLIELLMPPTSPEVQNR